MIFEKKQIEKLINKMKSLEMPYLDLMFEKVLDMDVLKHNTEEHLRCVPQDVEWETIKKGDLWGGPFKTMWLKGSFQVPEEYDGRKLVLCSDIDAFECLAFINGKPGGLFNKDGQVKGANHSVILISQKAKAGHNYNIALECYAGTPCLGWAPYENYGKTKMPDEDYIRKYNGLSLCAIREDVAEFVFDLKTLNQLLQVSEETSAKRGEVLAALIEVYKEINQYPADVDELVWRPAMHRASEKMKTILSVANQNKADNVGLIGHAHLDTAWLWTVSETKRKCARTLSNALALMEWYPEYTFLQSSALHGAWMKKYYPSIFSDMKMRISQGRYEPNGAVWVECDCNITGAESMVRQFLWGQRFTHKEYGYKSDAFWLPDTFGYSAAIPQIMKGCDVKYFLTTKMEWNESNHFPYDSFTWRGQDGSEVLVHLNRMDSWPDVGEVTHHFNTLSDKHVSHQKLLAYGYGDGGGGPQYQMLEMARRTENLEGCPKASHTTVSNFMKGVEENQKNLPVWAGELYLELHRGTLTSIHDIKKSNRKAEIALREYEMISVIANAVNSIEINKSKIESLWETLLRNQFHDILPGTCIPEVYDIAIPENYALIETANIGTGNILSSLSKDDKSVSFINTLNWSRCAYVKGCFEGYLEDAEAQSVVDLDGNHHTLYKIQMPAMGSAVYKIGDVKTERESAFNYDGNVLDTPLARITFAQNGAISSLIDKNTKREICKEHAEPLNTFYIAQDVPNSWDNWDIDPDIELKMHAQMDLISSKVVSDGALQFRKENIYRIGQHSTITQHMIFSSDTLRVDFETKIDWKEKHTLLKVGFDVDILTSAMKNEMQFGYVERPTHSNTSWEAAKTELCNHKWSDISDNRYGVSLLNDCKYGISCKNSNIMLTLLKSGSHPDPRGDRGIHEFTYSLLPHDGAFSAQRVVHPAYEINIEPITVKGMVDIKPFLSVDETHIVVEAVKPAEDIDGYVIRLYECEKAAVSGVKVTFDKRPQAVYKTNMLEEIKEEIKVNQNSIELSFKPFEIKTILVANKPI